MTTVDVAGVPECVECGCCCFSRMPDYVRVFGVDHARMDEHARSFTEFDGHRSWMRMAEGRCAALAIDPVALTYRCSIYAVRPDVCRSLERGSGACRADRHEKAERPLLAVERLLEARRGARVKG
jgi:Fe-S-cluster containining protein